MYLCKIKKLVFIYIYCKFLGLTPLLHFQNDIVKSEPYVYLIFFCNETKVLLYVIVV